MPKESEQNIGLSVMDVFVALDVDLFFIPICTKMGHNLNLCGGISYGLSLIVNSLFKQNMKYLKVRDLKPRITKLTSYGTAVNEVHVTYIFFA